MERQRLQRKVAALCTALDRAAARRAHGEDEGPAAATTTSPPAPGPPPATPPVPAPCRVLLPFVRAAPRTHRMVCQRSDRRQHTRGAAPAEARLATRILGRGSAGTRQLPPLQQPRQLSFSHSECWRRRWLFGRRLGAGVRGGRSRAACAEARGAEGCVVGHRRRRLPRSFGGERLCVLRGDAARRRGERRAPRPEPAAQRGGAAGGPGAGRGVRPRQLLWVRTRRRLSARDLGLPPRPM